jgi:hypothetical protein
VTFRVPDGLRASRPRVRVLRRNTTSRDTKTDVITRRVPRIKASRLGTALDALHVMDRKSDADFVVKARRLKRGEPAVPRAVDTVETIARAMVTCLYLPSPFTTGDSRAANCREKAPTRQLCCERCSDEAPR